MCAFCSGALFVMCSGFIASAATAFLKSLVSGYIGQLKGVRLAWGFSEAAVAWGNEHAREGDVTRNTSGSYR